MHALAYTVTNDIGEFRLSGLAPGDYYIVTRQRDARVDEFSEEPTGYGHHAVSRGLDAGGGPADTAGASGSR